METFFVQSNPVKGLLPYSTNDSASYYADETQAEKFFRQLHKNKFVVLTGNTGAGKTSFVNCIFSSKFKHISNIDDSWNIVHIRPGLNPIKNIGYFFSNSNFSEDKLSNAFLEESTRLLMSDSNGIRELFEKYTIKPNTKLVLVIDPLDDLFLLNEVIIKSGEMTTSQHVDAFINLICTFEQQGKDFPVYTVVSFSNSFPEKVGQYPKFLDLMEKNKFLFRGITIDRAGEVIDEIVPESVKAAKDYVNFREKIKHDIEEEFENTPEWLFFLQHALKETINAWEKDKTQELYKCYLAIGGVKDSIIHHADRIYDNAIKQLPDKRFERLYELLLRALIDSKGQFIPKYYSDVVEISTRFYNEKKDFFEEKMINPFIHQLAERELGFLEIIRSTEETERAVTLVDSKYITSSDVISIRNKCLISKWPRLEIFQNAKTKLISEYEWYSRFAHEKKELGMDNYPTTLQAYALADPKRDKTNDPAEFKTIDELFYLNEAWEESNFDRNRKGYASIADTKAYIKKGIDYWKEKARLEEKERRQKEKKRSLILYICCAVAILIILSFPFYKIMLNKQSDMETEFDCMTTETHRIRSYIDDLFIHKLMEYSKQNNVPVDTLKKMMILRRELQVILDSNFNKINKYNYELYGINEWQFTWEHKLWKERRNELMAQSTKTFNLVLTKVVNDNTIASIDTVDKAPANSSMIIGRHENRYIIYHKFNGVKKIRYDSAECDNSTIPEDSTYFLQCEICNNCKDCN